MTADSLSLIPLLQSEALLKLGALTHQPGASLSTAGTPNSTLLLHSAAGAWAGTHTGRGESHASQRSCERNADQSLGTALEHSEQAKGVPRAEVALESGFLHAASECVGFSVAVLSIYLELLAEFEGTGLVASMRQSEAETAARIGGEQGAPNWEEWPIPAQAAERCVLKMVDLEFGLQELQRLPARVALPIFRVIGLSFLFHG